MIRQGGYTYYDTPVGVLCLESYFAKPSGHVRNPLTFDFPVVCRVIPGVDVPRMLFNPDQAMVGLFLEAARQLEKDGVKAIVGSCGFMALYQRELSAAVRVPVAASSLAQLGLMRLLHGDKARIGILTASAPALTERHFAQMNEKRERYIIMGMEDKPVFRATILESAQPEMDMCALEREICDAAAELAQTHEPDALLLECTDLSAFAQAVQERINLPVYDINSLVEYVGRSVVRPAYPKRPHSR